MNVLLDHMHPFGSAYVVVNDDGTVTMGRWALDDNLRSFDSVHEALDFINKEQISNPDHMNIARARVLRESLNVPLH